jgi:hypothetical protein
MTLREEPVKKVLALVVAVVALSAAGIAYAALSPQGGTFQSGTVAFGGGHALILGTDKTFSFYAKSGHGTFDRNGTVVGFSCETIVGNAAVLGGAWTVKGENFMVEVVDNGPPSGTGAPAGDQISTDEIGSGKAPKVCPAPSDFHPFELDTVDAGDITVHSS